MKKEDQIPDGVPEGLHSPFEEWHLRSMPRRESGGLVTSGLRDGVPYFVVSLDAETHPLAECGYLVWTCIIRAITKHMLTDEAWIEIEDYDGKRMGSALIRAWDEDTIRRGSLPHVSLYDPAGVPIKSEPSGRPDTRRGRRGE